MLNERIKSNLNVLAALKSFSANGNQLNKDLVKGYSGWGGLREAVYNPVIYKELKSYLSDHEICSIKKTITSAYYTPELLVKFMWAVVNCMSFKPQRPDNIATNILEPAAGIGVFIEHMPPAIAEYSRADAIELDINSCKLLAMLYPDINIINSGFENCYFPYQKYDLIIGNPPYGRNMVNDVFNHDLSHLVVHHYFVAKSARILRDDGIIAMVLPQFFLDNVRDHARDIIADMGVNLIAAYRLPDDLFM